LEEKIQTYGHNSNLDLLAQLAKNKEKIEEEEVLTLQPPVVKAPTYHTTLSLGFEQMRLTDENRQEKENWEKKA